MKATDIRIRRMARQIREDYVKARSAGASKGDFMRTLGRVVTYEFVAKNEEMEIIWDIHQVRTIINDEIYTITSFNNGEKFEVSKRGSDFFHDRIRR